MTPRVEAHDEARAASTAKDSAAVRNDAGARRSESFLLRISAEPREARGSRRRLAGFVSHLGSGDETNFSDIESLISWLQERLQEQFGRPLDGRGPATGDETADRRRRQAVPDSAGSAPEAAGGRSLKQRTKRRRAP